MKNISPKVSWSVACAALVTCLTWFASLAGISVPVEVQGAVTTVLIAIVGYAVTDPSRS